MRENPPVLDSLRVELAELSDDDLHCMEESLMAGLLAARELGSDQEADELRVRWPETAATLERIVERRAQEITRERHALRPPAPVLSIVPGDGTPSNGDADGDGPAY